MRRILIHSNRKKESLEVKQKLWTLLKKNGFILTKDRPQIILSIGGDGTMLSAIRKYRSLKIPFLGINTGTLGFLPSILPSEVEKIVDILKGEDYTLCTYPMLKVYCKTISGENIIGYAFNEILIKHMEPRLMEAKVYINDKPFNYFTGDGFIVSTPIGATGYAIWAGGAVTHSDLPIYQITPLNPNDNSVNRPMKSSMIVPLKTKMDINVVKANRRKVIVACDGIKISDDYISDIKIRASSTDITILRWGEFDYFDLYRTKIIDKNINKTIFD